MENVFRALMERVDRGEAAAVETRILKPAGILGVDLIRSLGEVRPVPGTKGRAVAKPVLKAEGDALLLSEPVLPQERLIVLGGGHIALPVVQMAALCGFQITVVDDRPAFASFERFPQAAEVRCEPFEDAIRALEITPYDFVVVITRGHSHDADCLRALLPGPFPAYLGMIGSRRRTTGLLALLKEEGFDGEKLGKICTPIGLKIGAVTPAEIAVSILSEIIAYRRLPEYGDVSRSMNGSDAEIDTLRHLAFDKGQRAAVTIIETKGSTPRKAGAKMLVDPLGNITGSIGGGCGEAEVMQDAIRIIGTGRYLIRTVDLTDEVAEEDGMVCGGTMQVLIEDAGEA